MCFFSGNISHQFWSLQLSNWILAWFTIDSQGCSDPTPTSQTKSGYSGYVSTHPSGGNHHVPSNQLELIIINHQFPISLGKSVYIYVYIQHLSLWSWLIILITYNYGSLSTEPWLLLWAIMNHYYMSYEQLYVETVVSTTISSSISHSMNLQPLPSGKLTEL